jgi:predicted nucleotidyltransferase component of viral defense system
VDLLIDRRELLEKARQKHLNLMLIEKDYVLGWLLFGISQNIDLVFKGGTALAKIYFPRLWRLSEDLDFSLIDHELSDISGRFETALSAAKNKSGLEFNLKSQFSNPDYLQLKIQYQGVIGKNWIKVDITKDDLIDQPAVKTVYPEYSDYVPFEVKVESLEEIFTSKLRAIVERQKCRDYFDLWKLSQMDFDRSRIKHLVKEKFAVKNIPIEQLGIKHVFPPNLEDILAPYWEKELGRLISPLPEMKTVISDLKDLMAGLNL